jgi:predicted PurR-regulated permease PerM
MPPAQKDLTRTVLLVLSILLMIAAVLWILRPFLLATVWATMIVVTTWPLMAGVQKKLAGKRSLAVAAMCLMLLLFLVVPLLVAITALAGSVDDIPGWIDRLKSVELPAPPDFVARIPFFGEKLDHAWREVTAMGNEELLAQVIPYAKEIGRWLAGEAKSLGYMIVQFLLIVVIAAILYAQGEAAAALVRKFGKRLGGARGEEAILLAGRAIRSVALGIGVTALVQTLLAGIGLAVAGIPFAGALTALILLLCLAQIGAIPVLLPAVIWLYYTDHATAAIVLLAWTLVVGSLDNIIRPFLIKRGADLPLLLIMAGVIGGLLTFGIIGLFVGPVVLAVTYTLWEGWVNDAPAP